jgi:hypothetical protein
MNEASELNVRMSVNRNAIQRLECVEMRSLRGAGWRTDGNEVPLGGSVYSTEFQ